MKAALVLVAAQLSAGAIVARVKEQEFRIQDFRASAHLEITSGDTVQTRQFTLELIRDGVNYRALVTLEGPKAMAGTKFLIHAERGKRNREWAYFPDLDLVRSIPGKQQDDGFLGSDITYSDLAGGAHLDDLRHRLLGEEVVEGQLCYVMEGTPRHTVAYGKLRGFVNKDNFVNIKAMFFDHEGGLIKDAVLSDVRGFGDGIRLAHRVEVRSATSDSKTVLTFGDVRVNIGLSVEAFTEGALAAK